MSPDWRDDAACVGVDTGRFFHPDGERERDPDRQEREGDAKRVCHGCPVRVACLDEAFTAPQEYGTWGGMTERERRTARRRRALNVPRYLRLRAAGLQPAAAAHAASSPETEVAVNA